MAHEGVDLIDTASLNQLDLVFVPAIPHRKFVFARRLAWKLRRCCTLMQASDAVRAYAARSATRPAFWLDSRCW